MSDKVLPDEVEYRMAISFNSLTNGMSKAEKAEYILSLLPQDHEWTCPHCYAEHKCSSGGLITREKAMELLELESDPKLA